MSETESLTKKLDKLIDSLTPDSLKKAVRGGFAREAARMRKIAAKELQEKLPDIPGIGKNVKGRVRRDLSGAYANVRPHGKAYMRATRRGKLKPIAFWMNNGVTDRETANGQNRGSIEGKKVFVDIESKALEGIETRLGDDFQKVLEKKAKESGLL